MILRLFILSLLAFLFGCQSFQTSNRYSDEDAFALLEEELIGQHHSDITESYYEVAKKTQNASLADQGMQIAYAQGDNTKAFDFALLADQINEAQAPDTAIFFIDTMLDEGRYAQAASYTETLLDAFPEGYYQSLADFYESLPLMRTNYVSKLKAQKQKLNNYPGYWQILAATSLVDGNKKQAFAENGIGLERFPSDDFLRFQQVRILKMSEQDTESDALFESLANDSPDNELIGLSYLEHLISQGNVEQAKAYSLANVDDIDDGFYVLKQADIFNNIDEFDTAEKIARTQLRNQPDETNYLLAQIVGTQGSLDEAYDYLSNIPDDSRISYEARTLEAEVLVLQERYGEAETLINTLYDDYPLMMNEIIDLEGQLYRNSDQHLKAIALYSLLIRNQPTDTNSLYYRGLSAMYVDYEELVISDMNQVLSLEPDNFNALNGLGYYYADKGINLPEAESLLSRALEIDPLSVMVLDSWGWLRYKQGYTQEALDIIQTVYDEFPEDPEISSHMGEIYWAVGRKDEALAVWKQAADSEISDYGRQYLNDTMSRLGARFETP